MFAGRLARTVVEVGVRSVGILIALSHTRVSRENKSA